MTGPDLIETATRSGRVRGRRRENGSIAFLGIPFAEPPVGDLRFAAPVPSAGWAGVRDALEYGATPQRTTLSDETLIPEPCVPGESTLNVNVFTPTTDADAGLPVLVYFHGGGYSAGSPASPWYDGAAFNRDGVVTVTVSYRLGFDGFGWISDAPHNRALLDWLLALEWVRDNIRAFGGDPGRVTIAGQSAGGSAVLTLLAMPKARGLFHGVFAISPPDSWVTAELAEKLGRRLAELGSVDPTRSALAQLDEERVRELQDAVTRPAGEGPTAMIRDMLDVGLSWAPMVDGDLLPLPALDAFRAGIGADIPIVLGATDDEFGMLIDPASAELYTLDALGVEPSAQRGYLSANPELAQREADGIAARYVSDRLFRSVVVAVSDARGDAATWCYRFGWASPIFRYSVHCLDVPFFFDCLGADRVPAIAGAHPPQALADDLHSAAVSFIVDGAPGWEPASETKVFDVPSTVVTDGYAGVRPLLTT
jgi:para-nitrobenzyl esterase